LRFSISKVNYKKFSRFLQSFLRSYFLIFSAEKSASRLTGALLFSGLSFLFNAVFRSAGASPVSGKSGRMPGLYDGIDRARQIRRKREYELPGLNFRETAKQFEAAGGGCLPERRSLC